MNLDYSLVYKYIYGSPAHNFFHQNTALNATNILDTAVGIENAINDPTLINYLYYSEDFDAVDKVILPPAMSEGTQDTLLDVLIKRRSVRSFSKHQLPIQYLSNILHYSFGISGVYNKTIDHAQMRLHTFPSAGGLCPLRFYIIAVNVESIENGLYLYNPYEHCLNLVRIGFEREEYGKLTGSTSLCKDNACSIHIVGNMKYTGYKYGDRGYRFMHLEAGHAAQNVYLSASALGIGVVASGGFYDKALFDHFQICSENRYLLYEMFIGIPDESVDYRFSRG